MFKRQRPMQNGIDPVLAYATHCAVMVEYIGFIGAAAGFITGHWDIVAAMLNCELMQSWINIARRADIREDHLVVSPLGTVISVTLGAALFTAGYHLWNDTSQNLQIQSAFALLLLGQVILSNGVYEMLHDVPEERPMRMKDFLLDMVFPICLIVAFCLIFANIKS